MLTSIGSNRIQGVKQIPSSIGGHVSEGMFAPTERCFPDFVARRGNASALPAPRVRSARARARKRFSPRFGRRGHCEAEAAAEASRMRSLKEWRTYQRGLLNGTSCSKTRIPESSSLFRSFGASLHPEEED